MALKRIRLNKIKALAIVVAAMANLSMVLIDPFQLLTDDDLRMEAEESIGQPALSAALDENPYWESFNSWNCFSTANIKPYCAEIDSGKSFLPTLQIADSRGTLYDFSLDPEPDLNCEETLTRWLDILQGQNGVCIFAAFLQNLSAGHELWIVDTIKTYKGQWSMRIQSHSSSN